MSATRPMIKRHQGSSLSGVVCLSCLLAAIPFSALHAAELHVSAGAAAGGDGSAARPFRTINAAAATMHAGDTCVIHGGLYSETVRPAASGTAQAPITFRGGADEKVVITGCDPVTGWQREDCNVYSARIRLTLGHENQVFCGEDMMWEARWPSADRPMPEGIFTFPTVRMGQGTSPTAIIAENLPAGDWVGAGAWIRSGKNWICWTSRVKASDGKKLTIDNNGDRAGNHNCKQGGRFFLFGVRAALDADNEWFYDDEAGKLYVIMPGGSVPGDRVSAKRRMAAFDLSGRKHVHVKGLDILGASVAFDDDSEGMVLDRVRIRYLYHSNRGEQQYHSQITSSGIVLAGSGHTIRNCEMAYSSGNILTMRGRTPPGDQLSLASRQLDRFNRRQSCLQSRHQRACDQPLHHSALRAIAPFHEGDARLSAAVQRRRARRVYHYGSGLGLRQRCRRR